MAQEPVIYTARETFTTIPSHLTINGSNFGKTKPLVTLNTTPLNVVNYTDTAVVAEVPLFIDSNPGSYLLSLTNIARLSVPKDPDGPTGSFDVAIGAAGPAGPAGKNGSSGPPVLPVPADLKAPMESQDQREQREHQAPRGLPARLDLKAPLESQDQQGRRALLEQLGPLELRGFREFRESRALRAHRDRLEPLPTRFSRPPTND
jgi:hypothetical protein